MTRAEAAKALREIAEMLEREESPKARRGRGERRPVTELDRARARKALKKLGYAV